MRLVTVIASLCLVSSSADGKQENNNNSTSSIDCHRLGRKAAECVRVGIGFIDPKFQAPRNLKSVSDYCA